MSRLPRRLALIALLCIPLCAIVLFETSCTAPPNTQSLPIGQRCNVDDECGTSPFNCTLASHPGGYCDRACATDGDCPLDAVCASLRCRRRCASVAECRAAEGYVCRPIGASYPYCDVPAGSI